MSEDTDYCRTTILKRKRSGHFTCSNCNAVYNNAHIPKLCTNTPCDQFLGGKYEPKVKQLDAKLLTEHLVSVRVREKGLNIRTFVQIGKDKKVRIC